MRKRILALILALGLLLTGCGTGMIPNPKTVDGGIPWENTWTNLGGMLGVEQPGGDFKLLSSNGRLEGMEIFYATWVCGEETKTGDTSAFDGQIYLMAERCDTAEEARENLVQWQNQFAAQTVTARRETAAGDCAIELVAYDCPDNGHFSRGITALWQRQELVLVVDIACIEALTLDLDATMEHFLGCIHYAD